MSDAASESKTELVEEHFPERNWQLQVLISAAIFGVVLLVFAIVGSLAGSDQDLNSKTVHREFFGMWIPVLVIFFTVSLGYLASLVRKTESAFNPIFFWFIAGSYALPAFAIGTYCILRDRTNAVMPDVILTCFIVGFLSLGVGPLGPLISKRNPR